MHVLYVLIFMYFHHFLHEGVKISTHKKLHLQGTTMSIPMRSTYLNNIGTYRA